MATVWIPSLMRDLTAGKDQLEAPGRTVGEALTALEAAHPGFLNRLCDGDRLDPGLTVSVDGRVARLGLLAPIGEHSQIHFLPAVAGG